MSKITYFSPKQCFREDCEHYRASEENILAKSCICNWQLKYRDQGVPTPISKLIGPFFSSYRHLKRLWTNEANLNDAITKTLSEVLFLHGRNMS